MDKIQFSSILLILGTVLTGVGFGAFPTRIYTARTIQEKLDLLASQPRRWVLCQSLVIFGGICSMAGAILLISFFTGSPDSLLALFGALGFLVGHVFWLWHVVLRIVRPREFAQGELPGWLFSSYSMLAPLGLVGLGAAFWLQGMHPALGAGLVLISLAVLGFYLKFKDMYPFTYYVMTLAIGVTLLF